MSTWYAAFSNATQTRAEDDSNHSSSDNEESSASGSYQLSEQPSSAWDDSFLTRVKIGKQTQGERNMIRLMKIEKMEAAALGLSVANMSKLPNEPEERRQQNRSL